jgi:hypothetical protein
MIIHFGSERPQAASIIQNLPEATSVLSALFFCFERAALLRMELWVPETVEKQSFENTPVLVPL